MKQITAQELKEKLDKKADVQLIDVREDDEHEAFNIGGSLIPLGEIMSKTNEIATDKDVIIYCRKGIRSQIAIQRLQQKYGFTNLVNLQGGLEKWEF